jgi:hypothetical protein
MLKSEYTYDTTLSEHAYRTARPIHNFPDPLRSQMIIIITYPFIIINIILLISWLN